MTQAVADTLRRALALIDTPEMWWNGHGAATTAICAGQAIIKIEGFGRLPAGVALSRIVAAPVQYWNDAPGRTHAEVIAAFDAAIAAEESEP